MISREKVISSLDCRSVVNGYFVPDMENTKDC